jgi:hypothetical protein
MWVFLCGRELTRTTVNYKFDWSQMGMFKSSLWNELSRKIGRKKILFFGDVKKGKMRILR